MVGIVVTPVGGSPKTYEKDCVKLGRLRDADVCLEKHGSLISRFHAAVFFEDGELYVKDLGSRTGTFLNGERVKEPVSLVAEDVVKLGGSRGPAFSFAVAEAKAEAKTEPPKRSPRKRPLASSAQQVALDAVIQKERVRSNRLLAYTIGGAGTVVVACLIVVAVVLSHRAPPPPPPVAVAPPPVATGGDAVLSAMAGDYQGTTTEAGGAKCWIYVHADGAVERWVQYPDGFFRTRWGKAAVTGQSLRVQFDNPGDPFDLAGDWEVSGERAGSRYGGTAKFEKSEEGWRASLSLSPSDDPYHVEAVVLTGKLGGGGKLSAERASFGGDSAHRDYTLNLGAMKLVGKFDGWTESFSRRRLPQGPGTAGTYTFQHGTLSGNVETGAKDECTRGVEKKTETAKVDPRVTPDPVPSIMFALRDTKAFADAALGARALATFKAGTGLHVVEKKNDLWWGIALTTGAKDARAYVRVEDVQALDRHFKPVKGPLLAGTPRASGGRQYDLGICYLMAALMSIAQYKPEAITSMIRDHDEDGTVEVRFYRQDERQQFEEQWVRVKKSVVVDDHDKPHYVIGDEGNMWAPIIVKAYAALNGGYYAKIEGGYQGTVFEQVLGRPFKNVLLWVPMPWSLDEPFLAKLPPADRKLLTDFHASKAGVAADKHFTVEAPWERCDLDKMKKLVADMKLSTAGRTAFEKAYAGMTFGPVGSTVYTKFSLETVYGEICKAVEEKRPAGAGTWPWGAPGAGASGENMAVVPGLASSHAYGIVGVSEHDGLKWIRVQNPWRHFGRRYARTAGGWKATTVDNDPGDHGEFEVELSDFMRYFSRVDIAK